MAFSHHETSEKMKLKTRDQYHASVLEIHGKFLGAASGKDFNAAIDAIIASGKTRLVVDLSETTMMDSTAIGLLIKSLTSVRRENGDIRLAGMSNRLRNLFLMTRLLGPVFEAHETVDEAVNKFGELAGEVTAAEST